MRDFVCVHDEDGNDHLNNIDICVTCVGSKPPVLPLREERISLGIEMVYNARGVAARGALVDADQSRRKKKRWLRRKRSQNNEPPPLFALSYERYWLELLKGRPIHMSSKTQEPQTKSIGTNSTVASVNLVDDFSIDSMSSNRSIQSSPSVETEEGCSVIQNNSFQAEYLRFKESFTTEDFLTDIVISDSFEKDYLNAQEISMPTGYSSDEDDGYKNDIQMLKRELEQDEIVATHLATACKSEANDVSFRLHRCQKTYFRSTQPHQLRHSSKSAMRELAAACVQDVYRDIASQNSSKSSDNSAHIEPITSITDKNACSIKSVITLPVLNETYTLHIITQGCVLSHCVWIIYMLKGLDKYIRIVSTSPTFSMISYNYGINIDGSDREREDKYNIPNENHTVVCREMNKFSMLCCDYDGSYNYRINIDDDNREREDKKNIPNENHTIVSREMRKFPMLCCDYEGSDSDHGTDCESSKMYIDFLKLLQMLNSAFPTGDSPDLYPKAKKNQLDFWIDWLQNSFLHSIYQCGLAHSQQQYDDAIEEVTDCFDLLENKLELQGYLISEDLTVVDILAFSILLPWDEIYRVCFKISTRIVAETPAILKFMRTTYKSLEKNAEILNRICNMKQLKREFFELFPSGQAGKGIIIPRGEDFLKLLQAE